MFLTAKQIAERSLANLSVGAVSALTVHRDYDSEFVSGKGRVVSIRKPSIFEAKEFDRATGTEPQDANETFVDVTLDTFLDVTVPITDEELSLDIEDFDAQVIQPAMTAIVEGIEQRVAEGLATFATEVEGDTSDPKILAKASAALSTNKVARSDRHAIVSPATYGEWITKPPFDKQDSSGSDSALREAQLGRAYSFDTYEVGDLPAGVDGVAYHRTALALVTRTPSVPTGVTGHIASHEGFAVRVTWGYDHGQKVQTISFDVLVGIKVLDEKRGVVLSEGAEG